MDSQCLQRKDSKEAHKCQTDLTHAQNMIRNHKCDPEYKDKRKKQKEKSEDKPDKKDKDSDELKLSFAQMRNVCWCCGKNHKLPDCLDKLQIAKENWLID